MPKQKPEVKEDKPEVKEAKGEVKRPEPVVKPEEVIKRPDEKTVQLICKVPDYTLMHTPSKTYTDKRGGRHEIGTAPWVQKYGLEDKDKYFKIQFRQFKAEVHRDIAELVVCMPEYGVDFWTKYDFDKMQEDDYERYRSVSKEMKRRNTQTEYPAEMKDKVEF